MEKLPSRPLSRQPPKGSLQGGGLRFGELERDAEDRQSSWDNHHRYYREGELICTECDCNLGNGAVAYVGDVT